MYRGRSFPLVLLVAVNFLLNSPVNAGVVKRSIRMVREVYPPDIEPESEAIQPQVCIVGDVVYGADEPVPAEQPCLKCRCRPPGVQCETVQCTKKPGCKAIHRSNKCCPDYQCECEHNGKIYANGEKLETNPGSECKVCYCRGGEVQCAEVSCYIRKDCEGRRVPGTCCLKYDHCPPIDAVLDRTYLTTESPVITLKPVVLESWPDGTNSTDVSGTPTLNSIPEDSNKVPDASDPATEPPSFQEVPKKDEGMLPRITIHEIIPERKEIPITAPPKIFISEPQGTLLIEEALPLNENSSNDLNSDIEPDSSEISEVFQHPPPVLRIGDKLLFLKKGDQDASTSQSVITIIGAEGLQRGGVEESLEVHEVKLSPEVEVSETKGSDNDITRNSKTSTTEASTQKLNEDGAEFKSDEEQRNASEINDLELRTAESTHILSLVKKKNKNDYSSTSTTTTTEIPITEEVLTTLAGIIEEPGPSEITKLITDSADTCDTSPPDSKEGSPSTTTVSTTRLPLPEPTTEPQSKNTEPVAEQNPAYPPIPDIMPAVGDASQKFDIELENDNATTMEIKILPEVFDFLSNKTKNETVQSHSEWLKTDLDKNPESLLNFKAGKLPDELLNQRSAIDEDEDVATTTGYDSDTLTEKNIKFDEKMITNHDSISNSEDRIIPLLEQPIDELKPVSEAPEKKVKKDKLEAEGAQLIAEVKLTDDLTAYKKTNISFVLPPLATSKTIATNDGNGEPDVTTGKSLEEAAASADKSVESLEAESGEQTTPKTNHASIVSTENASVESVEKAGSSESNDMVRTSSESSAIEHGSVELIESREKSVLTDVEMITTAHPIDGVNNLTSTGETAKQDVELINAVNVPKPTKMDKVESSTYELLPTPEETKSKTIIKRDANTESSHEDVFKDLEQELSDEDRSSHKNPEEERAETDKIIQELLDETTNTEIDRKPKTKEEARVNDISNALSGVLKGRGRDGNVLRLFTGLFGGNKK